MDNDRRTEYVASLRRLADLIEQHEELPVPYGISAQWIDVVGSPERQREVAQTFARTIPGVIRKNVRGASFDLDGNVGPIGVTLIVDRASVCTRVVKEVREVTREVADPDAPTITVTETVEDVEWVCEPLLAERATA